MASPLSVKAKKMPHPSPRAANAARLNKLVGLIFGLRRRGEKRLGRIPQRAKPDISELTPLLSPEGLTVIGGAILETSRFV